MTKRAEPEFKQAPKYVPSTEPLSTNALSPTKEKATKAGSSNFIPQTSYQSSINEIQASNMAKNKSEAEINKQAPYTSQVSRGKRESVEVHVTAASKETDNNTKARLSDPINLNASAKYSTN